MISAVKPPTSFADRKFCIAIDLGYTYGGIAVSSRHDRQIYTKPKEPVSILYLQDEFSRCRPIAFGEKTREITSVHNRDLVFVDGIKKRIEILRDCEDNLSILQITSDLFGFYKAMALNECRRVYDNFDEEAVQWIIGIPQSFTTKHKSLLRQAAFEAGIIHVPSCDTLILCTEAEAALMAVRDSGVEMEDHVTVADVGASRTTIETFKIINGQYLNVSKTVVLKGSENVDEKLLARFKERVGEEYEYWTQNIPGIAARIKTQFKVFKEFSSMTKYSDAVKKIRIAGNDIVLFKNSEAKEIINNVIQSITTGIATHFSKQDKPKMSLVVIGGFAKSGLFTKSLVQVLGNEKTVIIPKDPSKIVLEGLTSLGIRPNRIMNRVNRFSYGTQFSKVFDPKVDDPKAYRWGQAPNQFIASFLPFTTAGKPISPDKVFEQLVCPANDHQSEFPFGLYYSMESNPKLSACTELITLTVAIPESWRHLGRENRFRILMCFGITEIKFSVIHTQSNETHESLVTL